MLGWGGSGGSIVARVKNLLYKIFGVQRRYVLKRPIKWPIHLNEFIELSKRGQGIDYV